MHKNSIILIVATLMMFSSFAMAFEVSATTYNNTPSVAPQVFAGLTEVGNVYIYANGTVSNTSAVQQAGTTNTYNLLVNVNGTLSVERNNTIVNGNNLTINGELSTAVASSNVTGLTFEYLGIVNSSYGIRLTFVQNAVINNVTVNNTASLFSMNMVQAFYSGNVTIENSTFIFPIASTTDTYGINAEYGSDINVSYNRFTGATSEDFVYAYDIGQLSARGNSIESTSLGNGYAFYFEYGGNSLFANNYINATGTGIWVEYGNAVTTTNNYLNNTGSAFSLSDILSYNSINDTALNSRNEPLSLSDAGHDLVQHANYTNSGSYIGIYYSAATLSDITYNTSKSSYGIQVEDGSSFNLYNSKIKNTFTTYTNAEVLYFEYMSGWVNLVNDNISGTYFGVYLDYSPQFNVTGSQINSTYYGIYANQYAITGSRITGDTFHVPYNQEAVFLKTDDVYNVNISNNTILSPNSSFGADGIYIYSSYAASNITIVNNFVLNNDNAVYVDSVNAPGTGLTVNNNTILNSTTAIYLNYFSNVVVSGNTITNTSDGITVDSSGIDVNVSNNLVENLPGFGGIYLGIYVEYAYGGNNIVSHNTVINVGSSSSDYGIEVYASGPVLVFSNTVLNGGYYGLYLYYNGPVIAFGNSVTNATYGIYSDGNYNFSYYSNTITNSNYSFYSYEDEGGVVFANTFLDTQSNSSGLYLIYIDYNYLPITFYHNNFINRTTNSTTINAFYLESSIFMNLPLPVGGNYYSNYTGSGTNGIGSTPMNLSGSIQDIYPLLNKWTSPTVTFLEDGLPSGTPWSVMLGSILQSGSGSNLIFQDTNGQYATQSYSVMNVPGYTASVTSGTVSLDGSSNVVTVNFSPVNYTVKFTESGLSSGTSWSVTLNGQTKSSTTQDISFSVSNGSYSYTIGSVNGYTTTTSTGSVQVSGSSQSVSVQYNAVTAVSVYTLTVNQTGLPSGDTWSVTVGNNTYNTTSDSISVQLAPGTYNISVSGPSGYSVSLQSSNVTMNNSNGVFNVTFTASKSTGSGSGSLYAGIGIGVIVGGVAGLVGTMFYTGTGIFRKPGE